MKQILASFCKEWLLLWRDKIGLIFLFILPMCLVFFITLTESGNNDKSQRLKILLFNQDQSSMMQTFVTNLKKVQGFKITEIDAARANTVPDSKLLVAKGKAQALIVIPKTASQTLMQGLPSTNSESKLAKPVDQANSVEIFVDPTLPKVIQNQLSLSLRLLLAHMQLQIWQQAAWKMTGKGLPVSAGHPALPVTVVPAKAKAVNAIPNEVQQNVPAWALFGMFFIITPLSGVLVKERTLGVMNRLHIAPVSFMSLIFGKIAAFVLLNLVQLALMLSVGVFILPLFGLPLLNVQDHLWQILLIGICASLAATGFGMLVGSFVRTPEQANVVGPFLIVIAAALGGIFVPIYLLPEAMQKVSAISPMHWAHMAFLDVFVRNAGLQELWPNLLKLLALFAVTTWLAFMKIRHRPN